MGRIIVIANQKGGVGKTTTAINLAVALAEHGAARVDAEGGRASGPVAQGGARAGSAPAVNGPEPARGKSGAQAAGAIAREAGAGGRVLLIDLDPQGNATSGLKKGAAGEEPAGKTMYEALLEGAPLQEVIVAVRARVDVAPSSADLVGAEIELAQVEGRERRLLEALKAERDKYEFILIDTPPSLGLLTLNALVAADGVLAPMQCEYYALEGLSALLKTVERVRETLNPRLKIEGVALTMFDARNRLSEEIAREVAGYLPSDVFQAVIPRNVRLSESPSHGLSVLEYDSKSAGAEAYRSLAKELRARIASGGEAPEEAKREGAERGSVKEDRGRWSLRALFARKEGRRKKA